MAKKAKTIATVREVRLWAFERGYQVGTRGRLPVEVLEAFTKATGRTIA